MGSARAFSVHNLHQTLDELDDSDPISESDDCVIQAANIFGSKDQNQKGNDSQKTSMFGKQTKTLSVDDETNRKPAFESFAFKKNALPEDPKKSQVKDLALHQKKRSSVTRTVKEQSASAQALIHGQKVWGAGNVHKRRIKDSDNSSYGTNFDELVDAGLRDSEGNDPSQSYGENKKKRRRLVKKAAMLDLEDEDVDYAPAKAMPRESVVSVRVHDASGTMHTTNWNTGRTGRHVEDFSVRGQEGKGEVLKKGSKATASEESVGEEDEDDVELVGQRETDPVLVVLRRCEGIAAMLKRELNSARAGGKASALSNEDCVEVDAPVAQLATQADIEVACTGEAKVLKPYQLVGVNFLLLLHQQKVGGAILADEMGLGKTAQAIAFLALLVHLKEDHGPHLVVVPASLLDNWQRELRHWCPTFEVAVYHGNERAQLRNILENSFRKTGVAPFNILLTTYSFFERDSSTQREDRQFLRRWDFSCVLLDEAHLLKDRASNRVRRLRQVAASARFRLMLTGTPLQNDLQELWSLLELLMPDIFSTIGDDLDNALGSRGEGAEPGGNNLIARMKGIMAPFVLRRVKADVMQQLAPKDQKVKVVHMMTEQAAMYEEALAKYRTTVEARSKTGSKVEGLNLADLLPKRQVANIFVHLRKVANHPLLVRQLYSDKAVAELAPLLHRVGAFGNECTVQRVKEEIADYSDFALHQLCATYGGALARHKLKDRHVMASGKCQELSKLLLALKKGSHRPLIFSQWTAMLDILEWVLDTMGLRYVRLDGSTQVSERQELVDEYNNNTEVFAFLLSTRAGGQGLNLTGADTVILHDVDFNPQVDRQAEDRCHRIGQTRPVTVYRLVTKGTVDESILQIAQRKLSLDAAMLDSTAERDDKCRPEGNDADSRTMGDILAAILAAPRPS